MRRRRRGWKERNRVVGSTTAYRKSCWRRLDGFPARIDNNCLNQALVEAAPSHSAPARTRQNAGWGRGWRCGRGGAGVWKRSERQRSIPFVESRRAWRIYIPRWRYRPPLFRDSLNTATRRRAHPQPLSHPRQPPPPSPRAPTLFLVVLSLRAWTRLDYYRYIHSACLLFIPLLQERRSRLAGAHRRLVRRSLARSVTCLYAGIYACERALCTCEEASTLRNGSPLSPMRFLTLCLERKGSANKYEGESTAAVSPNARRLLHGLYKAFARIDRSFPVYERYEKE